MLSSRTSILLSALSALPLLAGCSFGQSTNGQGATFEAGTFESSTGGTTLTASAATESFGTVEIGMQSVSVPVTITNAGSSSSALLDVNLSGANAADFGIDSDGCTKQALLPNGTCVVALHFKPSLAAPEQASLAVSAEGSATVTVALSGTGGSPGALAFSPTTQDFGSAAVGAKPAASTTFTLKNTGTTTTGNVTVALTGSNSADFALASNGCMTTLAAGATCAVGVTFGPMTPGTKAASLSATVMGAATTATASLSGTAVTGAAFAVTPSPFDFGPVESKTTTPPTQTFTVTNTGGTASGGVPSVVVSGAQDTDFVVGANGCTTALGAGATCTFGLTFAPSTTAAESATVTVSAMSTTSATVAVTGTGLPPASIAVAPTTAALGSVVQGAVGTDTAFQVTNGGGVTTGALKATLQGTNADQFALGTDGCTGTTLLPGASCTVNAHAAPTATGPVGAIQGALQIAGTPGGTTAATLTATTIAQASITISPTSQAMGTVAQGSTSGTIPFVVTNGGGVASGTLQATLTGTNATQFGIGPDACSGNPLGAGKSCTINVTFAPSNGTLGMQLATLSVTGTPGGTTTSSLTGTAATSAALTLTPASEQFPSTPQGTPGADVTFTVKNGGGVTSGTLATSLGGANVGQFAIGTDGCTGQTLTTTQTCTVTAHFAPSVGTVGVQQATLEVAGTPGGTATADLTGTPSNPLSIAPASPTLASGAFESPGATTVLTVTSASDASVGPLTVTVPAQFGLDTSKTTCSKATLTKAAPTCTIGVYLNPNAATVVGAQTGTLQVVGASANTAATDTLAGTALVPATLAITQAGAALPYTFAAQEKTVAGLPVPFVVTNNGGVASGTVAATIAGNADFTVSNNTCSAVLQPTGTCGFDVTFKPSTTTAESATLTVATTAGVGSSGTVSGTGGLPILSFIDSAGATVTSYSWDALVSVAGAVVAPTPATFTLVNTGTVATGPMATSGTLGAGFALATYSCSGQSLTPNDKCTVTVTFQNATPCLAAQTTLTVTDGVASAPLALTATGVANGADYVLTFTPFEATGEDITLTLGATLPAPGLVFTLTNCGNTTGGVVEYDGNYDGNYFSKPTSNTCQGNAGLAELATCTIQQTVTGFAVTTNVVDTQAAGGQIARVTLAVVQ